ncbi:transposase [Streptomyces sp. NBC_01017]|uniref:transposase n=1 Tax=Streptomyces sp. NBC_01017 TaxID=2903721 RepID=UPI00386A2D08|nr:transposase [Streptomyces sp. NBC_01017]WSV35307.1 transposase [Streptomyces sp. NBC_01017]
MWFVDGLYRDHAEVEDRVKAIKRVGLGLLPSASWQLNAAWVLAATIACDLDTWTRLLLLHDQPELAAAEPETIRRKLYHLPARLTSHARRRTLHLDHTWPTLASFLLMSMPAHRSCNTSMSLLPFPCQTNDSEQGCPLREGQGKSGI